MLKKTRHQVIIDILTREPVVNQEALVQKLRTRGLAVTKPTVSRDIAELGLVKAKQGYYLPDKNRAAVIGAIPEAVEMISKVVTKVSCADKSNILIIRTLTGYAQPVAIALDRGGHKEIVGTIGNSDTVLVIAKSSILAKRLKEQLWAAWR